jgi:hypothetical protein
MISSDATRLARDVLVLPFLGSEAVPTLKDGDEDSDRTSMNNRSVVSRLPFRMLTPPSPRTLTSALVLLELEEERIGTYRGL